MGHNKTLVNIYLLNNNNRRYKPDHVTQNADDTFLTGCCELTSGGQPLFAKLYPILNSMPNNNLPTNICNKLMKTGRDVLI